MNHTTSRCRTCGQEIIWAVTAAGKRMPLDALPAEDGNVALTPAGTCAVLDAAQRVRALADQMPLHRSHFSTCPNANWHRRK